MTEYSSSIALALRLITKKGRKGTRLLSVGVGVPSDPARPWKADTPGSYDDQVLVDGFPAVFLSPIEARGNKGQFAMPVYQRSHSDADDSVMPDATYFVYVAAASLGGIEPLVGMLVESLGSRYEIGRVQKLQPAEEVVMYTLSVKD